MRKQKQRVSYGDACGGDYMSVWESAAFTRSSESGIRRRLRTGELTRFKYGRRTLIKKEQLLALIQAEVAK